MRMVSEYWAEGVMLIAGAYARPVASCGVCDVRPAPSLALLVA
jgi:hypothetical protein